MTVRESPTRFRPHLVLHERHDSLRVEAGTLIIVSEEYYRCGSSQIITLSVTMADEIRLHQERWMKFPIDAAEREGLQETVHAALARQIRLNAMPLIANPQRGIEQGVDQIWALLDAHFSRVGQLDRLEQS